MRRFYPFALALMLSMLLLTAAFAQQEVALPVSQAPDQAQKDKPQAVPDEQPVTVKMNGGDSKKAADKDPVMGTTKLPDGKTSMIGGTVANIDGIRNRLGVKIFGGGHWNLVFDERTHFFRDGQETTFENVKKGDRVYVDTMLDGHNILARNVRVVTKTGPADARGQVIAFDGGTMQMQDTLSARPVQFQVTGDTRVQRDGKAATIADVRPGALIAVRFMPQQAQRGVAQEITVVAAPGETFTFAGRVTHLDLSTGSIAVENHVDNRTYDISFDKEKSLPSNLTLGSEITVAAVFDGKNYKANQINVDGSAH